MKKYFSLVLVMFIAYLSYILSEGNMQLYNDLRYSFPDKPVELIFTIVTNTSYLLYGFYSIYQYEELRDSIIIRIGFRKYLNKIAIVYLINIIIFFICNVAIDYILFREVNLLATLITSLLLFIPVIIIRIKGRMLEYILPLSVIIIVALKYIIKLI